MIALLELILLLQNIAYGWSKVVYNNPNNLKILSVAKNDEFIVSWNLDIREKGYLFTRMILREGDKSAIICKFDHKNFYIYDNIFQANVMNVQRTQLKLAPSEFELDEVLFSIENAYRINETAQNMEVYDYIPIFIIARPEIYCSSNQLFANNTLTIECAVKSKPEANINVGFQMMHNGFNTTKETLINDQGFSITSVVINFPLNVYYFNKMLFVSASVGKFHEMINVTISSKIPPFNVKLYFDDDNSEIQNISFYTSDTFKVGVRCSADTFTGQIQYRIKAPNGKVYNDEQIVLDRFDEKIHTGSWICTAKNEHGITQSQQITIKLLEEKPSIPMIKINHFVNSTNTFCVDFLDVILVNCLVISNKPFEDTTMRYTLQMINSGSKYNKTTNNHGIFNIIFDESYHENIYACRAENDAGVGSPAIFYLYKNNIHQSPSMNLMKTIELHSYYMFTVCCLTLLLVICVIVLIVKLQNRDNRILLCGPCYPRHNLLFLRNKSESKYKLPIRKSIHTLDDEQHSNPLLSNGSSQILTMEKENELKESHILPDTTDSMENDPLL